MTIDDVNAMLNALTVEHIVEPIDDPNLEIDFWDWAEVVGVVDQFVPPEYTN